MSNTPLNLYMNKPGNDLGSLNDKEEFNLIKLHLVNQNIELTNENKEFIKKHTKMQAEIDEKEEAVDTHENQLRYIKGELKNFVQLRELSEHIHRIYKLKQETYKVFFKQIRNAAALTGACVLGYKFWSIAATFLLHYTDTIVYETVFDYIFVDNLLFSSFMCIPTAKLTSFVEAFNMFSIKNTRFDNEIKSVEKEIKEIEDGNDFISKYIDNL